MEISMLFKSAEPMLGSLPACAISPGFEEAAAMAGLAPPGPEPPPKPLNAISGEEGATPEPNAPPQIPDFSPEPKPIVRAPAQTDSCRAAQGPENLLPIHKEGPPAVVEDAPLMAVALMGPILVPVVSFESPASESDAAPINVPTTSAKSPEPAEASKIIADVCPANLKTPTLGTGPESNGSKPEVADVRPSQPRDMTLRDAPRDGLLSKKLIVHKKDELEKKVFGRPEPAGRDRDLKAPAVNSDEEAKSPKVLSVESAKDEFKPVQPNGKESEAAKVNKAWSEATEEVQDKNSHPLKASGPQIAPAKEPAKTSDAKKVEKAIRKPEPIPADQPLEAPSKPELAATPAAIKPEPGAAFRLEAPKLTHQQTESVIRQVVDRVEALAASSPRHNVTIHLDPQEFGTITLVVRGVGQEIDAEVYATHEGVRHAVETHRPELQSGLEARGIQLGTMTVGSELSQGSARQEQGLQSQPHVRHYAPMPEARVPVLSLESIRQLSRKASGVDLWI